MGVVIYSDDDDIEAVHILAPGESLLYTWDNPNGTRKIKWGVDNGDEEITYNQLSIKVL